MKIEDRRKEGIPVTISLDSLEPGTIVWTFLIKTTQGFHIWLLF